MNYVYFLEDRLKLSLFVYDTAMQPFVEIKRKIQAGEEPYNATRHPDDDSSDPMYLEEWEQADCGADAVALDCLGQVQGALARFLRAFTEGEWGKGTLDNVSKMQAGSWFANYRALYATVATLAWDQSGADLGFLEEMILTRNDYQHGEDFYTPYTYQSDKHRGKYPASSFSAKSWSGYEKEYTILSVTRDRLQKAVDEVRKLAKFLDTASMARKRELRREKRANSAD